MLIVTVILMLHVMLMITVILMLHVMLMITVILMLPVILNPFCHPERSEGSGANRRTKKQILR